MSAPWLHAPHLSDKRKRTFSRTSGVLNKYGTDLVQQVTQQAFPCVQHRDSTAQKLAQMLQRKRNVVLIGENGVGKKAVVRRLAEIICQGSGLVSELWEIDVRRALADTNGFFAALQRLEECLDPDKNNSFGILCVPNLEQYLSETGPSPPFDGVYAPPRNINSTFHPATTTAICATAATELLGRILSRERLRLICTTTLTAYRCHIEKHKIGRQLQQLIVRQLPNSACVSILRDSVEHLPTKVNDDAILCAAVLGSRFVAHSKMPGVAVKLLEEASTRCAFANSAPTPKNTSVTTSLTDSLTPALPHHSTVALDCTPDPPTPNSQVYPPPPPTPAGSPFKRRRSDQIEQPIYIEGGTFSSARAFLAPPSPAFDLHRRRASTEPCVEIADVKQVFSGWASIPIDEIKDGSNAPIGSFKWLGGHIISRLTNRHPSPR